MSDRVRLPTAPAAASGGMGGTATDGTPHTTSHRLPGTPRGRGGQARFGPGPPCGAARRFISSTPGRMRRLLPKARLAPWSGPAGGPRCFFFSPTPRGRRRWLPQARLLHLSAPLPQATRLVTRRGTSRVAWVAASRTGPAVFAGGPFPMGCLGLLFY